jgi:hypothetical protein
MRAFPFGKAGHAYALTALSSLKHRLAACAICNAEGCTS